MHASPFAWFVTALALLVGACATNPVTGRRQFVLMSEAQEIAIGQEAEPQIAASMGFYDDPALQQYVEGIGLAMARRSERPALPWRFRVVDDTAVNAFAVPGGFICVTRGILAHMSNEAELASVLGHEIGHVTARHSVAQYTKQVGASLVLLPAAILLPSELQGVGGQLLGAGLQLLSLKYSRDDETQADTIGLGYMANAGYAPEPMVGMFETLDRTGKASGAGSVPEWMLTHPNPGNRAQRIRDQIARLPPRATSGEVGREEFLAKIDGMVFGADPREGWFSADGTFHHPALGFRVRFPAGWKTVNQRTLVAATSPDQAAMIQLGLVEAEDPSAAARAFAASQGLTTSAPQGTTLAGLPASSLEFAAATEQTRLRGVAVFVEHGANVYRLLGYGVEAKFSAHATALRNAVSSFARETDPAVLGVQPWKLRLVTPSRSLTQQEFAATYPGPVDAATLARINALDEGERYPAGVPAKRVVGKPLP